MAVMSHFYTLPVFVIGLFLGDMAVGSFAVLLPLFLCLTHLHHWFYCLWSGLCTGALYGGVP